MKRFSVTAMLTCFNRREKTISCIKSLVEGNEQLDFYFIITDDNSTDGTVEEIESLGYHTHIIHGDGNLFWNGGMYRALDYALHQSHKTDYYMLINDDVLFYKNSIEMIISKEIAYPGSVIVGACEDGKGNMTYGGVRLLSKHFARFELMRPTKKLEICDTFNGNCVLIPCMEFLAIGNVDPTYVHSMSDYDYGRKIANMGIPIYSSNDFVGECKDNDVTGSWRDTSLPKNIRMQKKESPKGLPKKDWFYFLKKHYGLIPALYHSATPYIRIFLGK